MYILELFSGLECISNAYRKHNHNCFTVDWDKRFNSSLHCDIADLELTDFLGVPGLHINSSLVSYQNRPRIYWCNIPGVTIPEDRGLNFQDYKETNYQDLKPYKVKKTPSRIKMWNNGNGKNDVGTCANITNAQKIYCLTRKQDRAPNSGLIEYDGFCRYLTRGEIEQAQTLPIGYTDCLTYSQMQDVCGDGWTVDVIAHIFKGLKEDNTQIKGQMTIKDFLEGASNG